MLKIRFSGQFKKDLKLAIKQGKDKEKLFEVVGKISKGIELEDKYKDHQLVGAYKDCRECHIEPDWLLIYRIKDDVLELTLLRTGTHSYLF